MIKGGKETLKDDIKPFFKSSTYIKEEALILFLYILSFFH